MSVKITPADGFDWKHVAWGHPDSPLSALCCYCSAGIGPEDVPFIIARGDGYVAQFCDACAAKWWGLKEC